MEGSGKITSGTIDICQCREPMLQITVIKLASKMAARAFSGCNKAKWERSTSECGNFTLLYFLHYFPAVQASPHARGIPSTNAIRWSHNMIWMDGGFSNNKFTIR